MANTATNDDAGTGKTDAISFKLLLIGNSGVGKSSILLRYIDNTFTASFITTIGIDFKTMTLSIDGERIKLHIWDTAGQERFRTITTAYYRNAMGIIIVYDVSSQVTFDNVTEWLKAVRQHCDEDVPIMLLANKCEVEDDKREVSRQMGQDLADSQGASFHEVSAKTKHNIDKAFREIAVIMLDKYKEAQKSKANDQSKSADPPNSPGFKLTNAPPKGLGEGCC